MRDLRAAGTPTRPFDLGLVAHIVRVAGVPCVLETGPDAETIWAEPRELTGRGTCWTVRLVRQRSGSGEIRVRSVDGGPGTELRPGGDERDLAAFVVVQALRVDPCRPLTEDDARAAGLAGRDVRETRASSVSDVGRARDGRCEPPQRERVPRDQAAG